MQKLLHFFLMIVLSSILITLNSCNEDEEPLPVLGVAFQTTGVGIASGANNAEVVISLSRATSVANTITVNIAESGVMYGQDYETNPAASGQTITLSVPAGVESASFTVTRLVDVISPGNTVDFTIASVTGELESQISGNTSLTLSFDAIASPGSGLVAQIGGSSQPNQVFIDFSLNTQTTATRDSWDLGFYTGSEDKVILNYSTYGMAVALDKTDMNTVSAQDTTGLDTLLAIGTSGAHVYIDHPDRDLDKLAIADISSTDSENKVYIINRGAGPGTGNADPGSANVGDTPRGWKKVRILKSGSDYVVQYADIDATTFQEVTVSKNTALNFVYLSLDDGSTPTIEPPKEEWDIVFSVSSNIINFGFGDGAYGFADFVLSNRQGGVQVAAVDIDVDNDGNVDVGAITYDSFTSSDLGSVTFSDAGNTIGSSWRSVFTRTATANLYFIVKDAEGNNYKVQFLGLLDNAGNRGHSSLKYELL